MNLTFNTMLPATLIILQTPLFVPTHSLSREKLNTLVSSSSCSSMRSLACPCSTHNSLLNPPIRVQTSPRGHRWSTHGLHEKRPLREAKISPNRDRSWEMMSPLDWMRGPIRCLPRATRFLRLDHLVCVCVLQSCVCVCVCTEAPKLVCLRVCMSLRRRVCVRRRRVCVCI